MWLLQVENCKVVHKCFSLIIHVQTDEMILMAHCNRYCYILQQHSTLACFNSIVAAFDLNDPMHKTIKRFILMLLLYHHHH